MKTCEILDYVLSTRTAIVFSIPFWSIILTGCSTNLGAYEDTITKQAIGKATQINAEMDNQVVNEEVEIITSSANENSSLDADYSTSSKLPVDSCFYDQEYIEENEGVFTYRLTDEDTIKKYDEIYFDAFEDIYNDYLGIIQWQDQHNEGGSLWGIDDVVYTYVDLNKDGSFELVAGLLSDDVDNIWNYGFQKAYAIIEEKVEQICEGGERFIYWLGRDGYIYKMGSSGAAYSGVSRIHYKPSKKFDNKKGEYCNQVFWEDEYVGYLYSPVHIIGSTDGIENASQVPESQISQEELDGLTIEWQSRHVEIEWLKLSDYMETHHFD